jgi:hypothetical protein
VSALCRDVYAAPLPGEGRWRRVLLADGNIGIGGDPPRLLRRCRRLAGAAGLRVLDSWTEAGRWFASLSRD